MNNFNNVQYISRIVAVKQNQCGAILLGESNYKPREKSKKMNAD